MLRNKKSREGKTGSGTELGRFIVDDFRNLNHLSP